MLKNQDIIHYIEKYRLDKKMPIYQLTKGITSTRNYSRMLAKEADVSIEHYNAFLKRFQIPIFEFSLYVYNCQFFENIQETHFLNAIENEQIEQAYEMITPYLDKNDWGFVYAHKTTPIAIKYVEYRLNKCTIHELLSKSRLILGLPQLLQQTMISLDDFEALFRFSVFCSESEKEQIADLLYRIIVKQDVKILNASVEHTTSRLHRLALQMMTALENQDEQSIRRINEVAAIALEYQSRAKIYGEDIFILQSLYLYYKKNQRTIPSLCKEYVMSILGSYEEEKIASLKLVLSLEEREWIISEIQNKRFGKTKLLEEITHDEFIK